VKKRFVPAMLFGAAALACGFSDDAIAQALRQAALALDRGQAPAADFWIARHVGALAASDRLDEGLANAAPLLKRRQLPPSAFVPGWWDAAFRRRFVERSFAQWAVDDPARLRERYFTVELQSVRQGPYFAAIAARPELEEWYRTEEGLASEPIPLAAASVQEPPLLFFGRYVNETAVKARPMPLRFGKQPIIHAFAPQFLDADGDGEPEVWLRFTVRSGNGFSQVLDVYRIREGRRLQRLHAFRAGPEGFARALADGRVEVASGASSRGDMARSDHDLHKIETWQWRPEGYANVQTRVVPHLLRGDDWKGFYFD
jgi:hypothetical protein